MFPSSPSSPAVHVIFGAGQVGQLLAQELCARGHEVRICRRGPAGPSRPGLAWLQGDASDAAFADTACRGATVVYNCANPSDYAGWDGVIQPLYRTIWQAAGRAGARLVALDNLYAYGRPATSPFDEDTPCVPCSRKGAIRRELADELLQAHAEGSVRACLGRASDYFGPEVHSAAVFGPRFFARLAAGKAVEAMGDPDQPHAYSYTPDVARGLAALGASDAGEGRVWHLPVTWTGTTRELMQAFAAAAGTTLTVRRIPRWVLAPLSFIPLVSAIREMIYQWEVPYVPADARFVSTFGLAATPADEAIRTTLHHFQGAERRAA